MKRKFKVTMITGNAVYDLPAPLCREIGRITVRWAFLERYLKAIAWEFLGLDAPLGRIAVRDPKPKQLLEMIRDIAAQQQIGINEAALKSLLEKIEGVSSDRDLITHGIWISTDQGWHVQRTSGTWPKQPLADEAPIGRRRVYPQGVRMEAPELRTIWEKLDALLVLAKRLRLSAHWPPKTSP